jgi:hypothetical protein
MLNITTFPSSPENKAIVGYWCTGRKPGEWGTGGFVE